MSLWYETYNHVPADRVGIKPYGQYVSFCLLLSNPQVIGFHFSRSHFR